MGGFWLATSANATGSDPRVSKLGSSPGEAAADARAFKIGMLRNLSRYTLAQGAVEG
jgi:hypothetical protein